DRASDEGDVARRSGHSDHEHRCHRWPRPPERRDPHVWCVVPVLFGDLLARHERADPGPRVLPGPRVHVPAREGNHRNSADKLTAPGVRKKNDPPARPDGSFLPRKAHRPQGSRVPRRRPRTTESPLAIAYCDSKLPTSIPPSRRLTPCVVMSTFAGAVLLYGPASIRRLSPSTTARTGIGARPECVIFQFVPSAVAFRSHIASTLSLMSPRNWTDHRPAKSA